MRAGNIFLDFVSHAVIITLVIFTDFEREDFLWT